jgi:hypothetical protein
MLLLVEPLRDVPQVLVAVTPHDRAHVETLGLRAVRLEEAMSAPA